MILKIRNMARAGLFAALMAVCAWTAISVPPVVVTMQTFAVLMTLGILGGKWGTISIFLYLAMGMVGLPVFAGFRGGPGALLDGTGGFLWGFAAGGLVYWSAEKWSTGLAMALCQLTCYGCGCLWFSLWAGNAGMRMAVLTCVIPYLIPDGIKLMLAFRYSGRIKKQLRKME